MRELAWGTGVGAPPGAQEGSALSDAFVRWEERMSEFVTSALRQAALGATGGAVGAFERPQASAGGDAAAGALPATFGGSAGAGLGQAAGQVLGHWSEPGALGVAAAGTGAMRAALASLGPRERFEYEYTEAIQRTLTPEQQKQARWRELSPIEVLASSGAALGRDPQLAPKPGEQGYTTSVNGRTFRYDEVKEDPAKPTRIADLMGPQAHQFQSRGFVTPRATDPAQGGAQKTYQDVTVLNADGTVSVLPQNEDGMVELPESGYGFGTHHRNDVILKNGAQKDQWGTPEMIANLINIGHDVHTLDPSQTVTYGDIATDDNKSPVKDAADPNDRHKSHGQGNQVDLRYLNSDFANNALIRSAEQWGMNNFRYSPGKRGKYFFDENSTTGANEEHRNHLHMGMGPGGAD